MLTSHPPLASRYMISSMFRLGLARMYGEQALVIIDTFSVK